MNPIRLVAAASLSSLNRYVAYSCVALACCVCHPSGASAQERQRVVQTESAAAQIMKAYSDGHIGADEKATLLAFTLFDPARLPNEYTSSVPDRCGTAVVAELMQLWPQLTEETRQMLSAYGLNNKGILSRPTVDLKSEFKTEHFTIRYSKEAGDANSVPAADVNANSVPDYIDTLASIAEHVWDAEINVRNFPQPLSADVDGRFPIYVFKIGENYGVTYSDSLLGDNPRTYPRFETNAYSSYITVRNEYAAIGPASLSEVDKLAITVAHEFFHAIVNGMDNLAPRWINESTSSWMEDEVYDNANQIVDYLPSWFQRPEVPLDASNWGADTVFKANNHWYGSWIFIRYLSEHVGGTPIVRDIWDSIASGPNYPNERSIASLKSNLSRRGTTLPNIFADFAAANYLKTASPYNYREGATYPNVLDRTVTKDSLYRDTLPRLATRYYALDPALTDGVSVRFRNDLTSGSCRASLIELTREGIARATTFYQRIAVPRTSDDAKLAIAVTSDDKDGPHAYTLEIVRHAAATITCEAPSRIPAYKSYSYKVFFKVPDYGLGIDTTGPGEVPIDVVLPPGVAFISASNPSATQTNGEILFRAKCTGTPYDDSLIIKVRAAPACGNDTVKLVTCTLRTNEGFDEVLICAPPVQTIVTPSQYIFKMLRDTVHHSSDLTITPWRVNTKRQVVGTVSTGQQMGFFWDNGIYMPLSGPTGAAVGSVAFDINEAGQVPVTTTDEGGVYKKTERLWTLTDRLTGAGTWSVIGNDSYGNTFGINSSGVAVGDGTDGDLRDNACKWSGQANFLSKYPDIEHKFQEVPGSSAHSINAAGKIAGEITFVNKSNRLEVHSAIWQGGYPTLIDAANEQPTAGGYGPHVSINDRDEIVGGTTGLALGDPTASRAYIWSGAKRNLGTFPNGGSSYAYGLNNEGIVAGQSDGNPTPELSEMTGCIWVNGKIVNLNCLADLPPDTYIFAAYDISDSGAIVGIVRKKLSTDYYGFIMWPNDELNAVAPATRVSVDLGVYAYPNPALTSKTLHIGYTIPNDDHVRIEVFDVLGNRMDVVDEGRQAKGPHERQISIRDYTPGTYFIRIQTDEAAQTIRINRMQ
jgi:hypothetical protein